MSFIRPSLKSMMNVLFAVSNAGRMAGSADCFTFFTILSISPAYPEKEKSRSTGPVILVFSLSILAEKASGDSPLTPIFEENGSLSSVSSIPPEERILPPNALKSN